MALGQWSVIVVVAFVVNSFNGTLVLKVQLFPQLIEDVDGRLQRGQPRLVNIGIIYLLTPVNMNLVNIGQSTSQDEVSDHLQLFPLDVNLNNNLGVLEQVKR